MAGVMISRFKERFTGKTKVKKLQGISDDELYGVASSEDMLKERKVIGGKKLKRGKNYQMNETSKRNTHWLAARTEAWKKTLTSGRGQEKASGEIAVSCSVMSNGKKYQKWNTKTGKEIESDTTPSSSSEIFFEFPALFLNELTPSKPVKFDTHQSYGQSCDPALVLEDTPGSGVLTSHVTLNVAAANAWEKTKRKTKVKKLQGISDDELYGVTSSEDMLKERKVIGGKKLKRGRNYQMNETSKRNTHWLAARTEAWKKTLTSGRGQEKASGEIAVSCSVMSNGKKYQKWNTKSGKEIKSDTTPSSSSENFDEFPPSFLNELAPFKLVNF
ncbi:hypothetical protein ACROYT_G010367 [Oculina patagonica]